MVIAIEDNVTESKLDEVTIKNYSVASTRCREDRNIKDRNVAR